MRNWLIGSPDLPSVSWSPREAGGIIPSGSEGLRTWEADGVNPSGKAREDAEGGPSGDRGRTGWM